MFRQRISRVVLSTLAVKEETIVLDFYHPLAGQALSFDIKVLGIQ